MQTPDPNREFHLFENGKTSGPYTLAILRERHRRGQISSGAMWAQPGGAKWESLKALANLLAGAAPQGLLSPINPAASGSSPPPSPSLRQAALKYGTISFCALLAFCLVRAAIESSRPGPAAATAPVAREPAPPPPPQPLRPEQVAERLRQSTVRVDAGFKVKGLLLDDVHTWLGSGVIFEKSRESYWILSNAHVVGSDSILNSKLFMDPVVLEYVLVVTMPDGKQASPTEVRINRHLKDFALIAVPLSTGNYTALPSNATRQPQGQKVFAMGHPKGLDSTFTSGVISSWRTFKTRQGRDYEVIQTDATINAGNSGGPLVDDYAKLIGINTFTLYRDQQAQGLNFAVSMGEISRSIQAGELVTFPLQPSRIGPFVLSLNRGTIR